MKKGFGGVAATVLPIVEGAVSDAGCSIWDIEFVKEGSAHVLRITIDTDREGGVGIDDCERVHRAVDPLLDEADPIESHYYLQISSPGAERDITMPMHIEACRGMRVEARLFAAINGSKTVSGELCGMDGDDVVINAAGGEIRVPFAQISKMKTLYDFEF